MKKFLISACLSAIILSPLSADVLASVNGEDITTQDIEKITPNANSILSNPDLKKRIIDNIITLKLVSQEAKKANIQEDPEYIKALQDAQERIIYGVYIDKLSKNIRISNSELKKFYDDNKDKFKEDAQVKASHILLKTEKEAKDIIDILKKLKSKKLESKFKELAKEKSIDKGSAVNGGDLGWFSKSQMVPEFADASFELKKGSINTKPVKSNFGYHVILKEDSKKAGIVKFDEVKELIENQVKAEKFKDFMDKKVADLKKQAKIEIK